MKKSASFCLSNVVNGFLIWGCALLSSCNALKDPKIYEESAELVEEVIKDEAK